MCTSQVRESSEEPVAVRSEGLGKTPLDREKMSPKTRELHEDYVAIANDGERGPIYTPDGVDHPDPHEQVLRKAEHELRGSVFTDKLRAQLPPGA
jgi:hypothetical protein